jgi:hypothetical protein
VYKSLNSTGRLIQRTTTDATQGHYVLDRTGCSQEDDHLQRQKCQQAGSPGRQIGAFDMMGVSARSTNGLFQRTGPSE